MFLREVHNEAILAHSPVTARHANAEAKLLHNLSRGVYPVSEQVCTW